MNTINILFVCGRNRRRSPTAQEVYRVDPRLQVRSAGTSESSKRTIKESDLRWADLVLVMERRYEARIRSNFPYLLSKPSFQSLDIPDDYEFMSEDLIDLLDSSVEQAIHIYRTEQGAAANP